MGTTGGALWFVLAAPDARPMAGSWDHGDGDGGVGAVTIARLADGVHVDDRSTVLATRLAALHDGQAARLTYRVEAVDGSTRWILELLEPRGAHPDRAVEGVAIDVTAEHAAFALVDATLGRLRGELETLRRREHTSATFARLLFHDVRAVLHDCRGALEDLDPALEEPALQRVHAGLDLLEELAVGSLETEHLDECAELRRVPVDLAGVARRLTERSDGAVEATDLQPAPAMGDPFLLERVVDNLVRNARTHTPPGTHVRVHTWADRAGSVLEVVDDGPGIHRTAREHAFEPVLHLGTDAGVGLGVGLSLVHRIVSLHGGRCSIRETPGGGTTVRVELPSPMDEGTPPRWNDRSHQAVRLLARPRDGDTAPSRHPVVG